MPTLTELINDSQAQLLGTLKQGQDAIVDGLKGLSNLEMPTTSDLPDPSEAINKAFGFGQELLDSQLKFVGSVIDAVSGIAARYTSAPAQA